MKIRPATKNDLNQCEKLVRTPILSYKKGHYIDKNFMTNYLDPNLFLVAEEKNQIIGLIIGERLKGNGVMILYLVVSKMFQLKGYGTKILEEFEKRCKKTGINWAVLYGPAEKTEVLNFYKKRKYIKGHKLFEFVKEF